VWKDKAKYQLLRYQLKYQEIKQNLLNWYHSVHLISPQTRSEQNYMVNWRTRRRVNRIKTHYTSQDKNLKRSRLVMKVAKFGFLAVVIGFLGLFFILPLLAFNLPSPDKIVRKEGFSTKISDRNGQILYDIYANQNRTAINIKDVPNYLKEATIAIEDKNFYKHQGFDPIGMLRGFSRIFTQGYAEGGSTLTQQLVKNVLLTSERSVIRKVKEFVLAIQIERKYSKDEILQMYLNEAPYGGTSWGVGTAAETYFGKKVNDLNLIESAILAGLPQRPSAYSPYSSTPKAYVERTKQVLRRMREDGYITQDQEKDAISQLDSVEFQPRGANFKAPHFVQYVQNILEDRYGQAAVEQGGLQVTTTLDLSLQEKAQEIVAEEIKKVENFHITNGAAVVIDPQTGEILSMVGSRGFSDPDIDGQVNVTLSLRQPGSSFKPFTYVTGFKKGYTPSTLLMDVPTEFPGGEGQPVYKPVNYDGKFRGPMQVRYALPNSINIVAVKMLALVGIKETLQTAYDMGLTTLEPTKSTLSRVGLSLTLGGGEVRLLDLTDAYSPFMNGGFKVEPIAILKVVDGNGKVLENNEPKKGNRVLTPEQAFLMADVLSDNDARKDVFGLNSLLNIAGRQIAVKTGTTNDKRDNWTIGGGPQVVVGVWVGNNDNSAMTQVASGVTGASPIWNKIIKEYLNGKPVVGFEQPGGIVTKSIDSVSGYASHDGFPSRIEKFISGTEPAENGPVHLKLKVCKSDGKIATPSDIASGNYDEKEYFKFIESDPSAAKDGPNKWQEGIDSWLATQSDPKYHPPGDYCGNSNPVNVDFNSPHNQDSNLDNKFDVDIKADSIHDITKVELFVDGEKVVAFTKPAYKQQVNLSDGVHKIKAKATDSGNNTSEREITVGIHTNWDFTPSPIPTNTPTPMVVLPTI
jgi:1A family penicillin-binding protein